jgi:hypothetical protein
MERAQEGETKEQAADHDGSDKLRPYHAPRFEVDQCG